MHSKRLHYRISSFLLFPDPIHRGLGTPKVERHWVEVGRARGRAFQRPNKCRQRGVGKTSKVKGLFTPPLL